MFIGQNGAGKSNLLEAVGILSSALGRGLTPAVLDYKGVRLSLPHLFKATFKNRATPQAFGLKGTFDALEYKCTIGAGDQSSALQFKTENIVDLGIKKLGRGPRGGRLHGPHIPAELDKLFPVGPQVSVHDLLGTFAEFSEGAKKEFARIEKYAIYTPQTAVMRGLTPDTRSIEPLGVTGGRLALAFKEVLDLRAKYLHEKNIDRSKFIDNLIEIIWKPGWADQVRTGSMDPTIVPGHVSATSDMIYIRDKYMKRERNYLSPYDASEGTLYLIFIATLLAHPEAPKVFALDNVDGTLNPGLVRTLVDHIVSSVEDTDRQVFLTSHNPTALDSLDIFNPDHKIYIVSRNSEGGTEFEPLLPPKGMNKQNWLQAAGGKSLSSLWLNERFPNALG